jgi:hypothetical protein
VTFGFSSARTKYRKQQGFTAVAFGVFVFFETEGKGQRFGLDQAVKAQKGSRGIALLFLYPQL